VLLEVRLHEPLGSSGKPSLDDHLLQIFRGDLVQLDQDGREAVEVRGGKK
jgi:hypothetical protein